ncbi:MAG: DUF488 family protein [Planctomycetota bacterium]|nr:DUF488 family protein [Planctomycetota bacterium]
MAAIALKRVYEPASKSDGRRLLVERLWPRGMKKDKARIDTWHKNVAPSPELRTWYGHDVEKWTEFKKRYRQELKKNVEGVQAIRDEILLGKVTFVYAARDEAHNSALVLKEFLEKKA